MWIVLVIILLFLCFGWGGVGYRSGGWGGAAPGGLLSLLLIILLIFLLFGAARTVP